MAEFIKVGDTLEGIVAHHADHIIEHIKGPDGMMIPVYCEGHTVTGVVETGSSKVSIDGKGIACDGDTGSTDCECDGEGFVLKAGKSKITIEGKPVVLSTDEIDIHGHGTGKIIVKKSKVTIGD